MSCRQFRNDPRQAGLLLRTREQSHRGETPPEDTVDPANFRDDTPPKKTAPVHRAPAGTAANLPPGKGKDKAAKKPQQPEKAVAPKEPKQKKPTVVAISPADKKALTDSGRALYLAMPRECSASCLYCPCRPGRRLFCHWKFDKDFAFEYGVKATKQACRMEFQRHRQKDSPFTPFSPGVERNNRSMSCHICSRTPSSQSALASWRRKRPSSDSDLVPKTKRIATRHAVFTTRTGTAHTSWPAIRHSSRTCSRASTRGDSSTSATFLRREVKKTDQLIVPPTDISSITLERPSRSPRRHEESDAPSRHDRGWSEVQGKCSLHAARPHS